MTTPVVGLAANVPWKLLLVDTLMPVAWAGVASGVTVVLPLSGIDVFGVVAEYGDRLAFAHAAGVVDVRNLGGVQRPIEEIYFVYCADEVGVHRGRVRPISNGWLLARLPLLAVGSKVADGAPST